MSARANPNAERRKKGFKKTIDPDDARRKREDNIIELRKAKRDESLQKKRAINLGPAAGSLEDSTRSNTAMQQKVGLIRNSCPRRYMRMKAYSNSAHAVFDTLIYLTRARRKNHFSESLTQS